MEPRSAVAAWEGDKLTIYTPTGGIANCRTDMARDLGIPLENVRVVCQYMGGNFGNKNQNQDADLIAATLAKQAGAPVKLELSRKEDFIGMHGRWPTTQYYKVGVDKDGTSQSAAAARLQRHGSLPQELGRDRRRRALPGSAPRYTVYPVYTNKTTSGNFRGPEFPQGHFGIQSMMDDVAYKVGMDPVDFVLKNMSRKANDQNAYTNYTLEDCIRRGAEAFEWKKRWRAEARFRRRASEARRGLRLPGLPLRTGPQQRRDRCGFERPLSGSRRRHRCRRRRQDHHGPDRRRSARRAAFASRSRLGRYRRCPYSVGESGSRTTIMTGYAVIEAAQDLKRQIAEKGMPKGSNLLTAMANSNPTVAGGKVRIRFGAHFVEVEVDTAVGHVRVLKYVAVHDSGRIMNPLSASRPDQRRSDDGHRHGAA